MEKVIKIVSLNELADIVNEEEGEFIIDVTVEDSDGN